MKEQYKKIISGVALALVLLVLFIGYIVTAKGSVQESIWALVPPVVAIALALITKEVYSSLFFGIVTGALLFSGYQPEKTMRHIFTDGIFAVLSRPGNIGILCFLVILGMMVQLLNKTGGSRAFGNWAQEQIKTRKASMFATMLLGCLIFIDDYFNCLTVGSVMLPVSDKARVSRAKLAYLIDTTAAPICIIAPISSWAAAVSGFVEGENGMKLFVETIPYNYYALLSICMMLFLIFLQVDFGPMAVHERNAVKGDLFTTPERPYGTEEENKGKEEREGKIGDMLFPVFTLVLFCVIGMLYSGGFFSGTDFVTAFSQSDAPTGLVLGSFSALLCTLGYYFIQRSISFTEAMACLPEGFKQMVPAILILIFAWSLKEMTDSLGAAAYVSAVVAKSTGAMLVLLPAFVFLIAVGLSFATGTSWGTFGILIPIVVGIFQKTDYTMMILAMSACMSGAVCGDHCSPISDTTIMSSAGAQCLHLNHVTTQLPYAMLVASVSVLCYVLAGILKSPWVPLTGGAILLFVLLMEIKRRQAERAGKNRREQKSLAR